MSDDKSKAGKPDRDRINVQEDYELRQWAEHFKVSPGKVREAVRSVGPMVKDVKKYLSNN